MKRIFTKLIYALQGLFSKRDVNCPFCQYRGREVVARKWGIVEICHCANCGVYWTNPMFRYPRLYDTIYTTNDSTTEIDGEELPSILESNFKGHEKDLSDVIGFIAGITTGRSLLEFGSSWGYFLYQAKRQGFEVTGVDISERMARFGNSRLGVNIVTEIDELVAHGSKYDVIFSQHTLEHIGAEIGGIFEKFSTLLKDDGVLVIEVPRLCLERGKAAFRSMGAVHPLGFTEEFFNRGVPQRGFDVDVRRAYDAFDPSLTRGDSGGILVAVCTKEQARGRKTVRRAENRIIF